MRRRRTFAPTWLLAIREAKRLAWEALPDEDRRAAIAAQAEWRARKARERKAKHLAKRERMGRIIELYLDGRTDEEIAAVLGLGLTGAMVRKFALDHELTVTRGDKLRRALTIDRLQERSLRRVAEDCDVPPGALLAELVAIALEEDGHVARRLLHVGKREGARAGAAA